MANFRIMSTIALGASLFVGALAIDCPAVNVEVYDSNDQSCGGGSSVVTLYNNTCAFVDSGFSSVHPGRASDPAWDNHCIVFTLVAESCSGTQQLTSGFAAWNGTSDYDPTCKNTTDSQGDVPHAFYMLCAISGGPSTCQGAPTGGGGGPTTTQPTMTTPSPTNTRVANPYVTSAVSSASSAVQRASSSVSQYQATPTDADAAQSAEDAIESAMAVNQEANNIASDYQASDIVSHLNDVDSALTDAAAAAVIAESAPEAAAAAAVAEAFGPAVAAIAAAVAAAAEPTEDPAPDTTTPRTTSTSSAGPCTLNIESADARLAESSPTMANLEGGTATSIDDTATPAVRRQAAAAERRVLDAEPTSLSSANLVSDLHELDKRDDGRTGTFCGRLFDVPNYRSWSSTGNNPYTPFYNYYSSSRCGSWSFNLVSSGTSALPAAPPDSSYPSQAYATEHVYEIQQIDIFLQYALSNVPVFQQLYNDNGTAFCQGFGSQLYSRVQFANSNVYNYNISPAQQIYNSLEGGTGDTTEFVYLENRMNNRKAKFFSLQSPSGFTNYQDELAAISRSATIAQYLQNGNVASIYHRVSDRVRQAFITFGQACNDTSAQQRYRRFGNIDWAGTYDAWESSYLDQVQQRLTSDVTLGVKAARALIDAQRKNGRTPLVEQQRLAKLDAHVEAEQKSRLKESDLSIAGLKRGS
ncbi:hypothetical protein PRZ48_000684 [Zasmidium cellare]|uniref:Uncharacterized protein n=1 Tax=Zasmidium cellare TaxID=395010 RepID=A0ABR0F0N4_ZASCE|nr:hypothetical protein PRZ48_000684 [Zasmidium cellare]